MKTSDSLVFGNLKVLTLTLIDSVHSTGNNFFLNNVLMLLNHTSLNLILQNHEIVMTTCGRYCGVRLAGNRS